MWHDGASVRQWLVHAFWHVYNCIEHVVSAWPNFALLGFVVSCGAAAVSLPLFLAVGLRALWSLAAVGPARKTFSTLLLLLLGAPAYLLLSGLVLAILWVVAALAALALAALGPLVALIAAWMEAFQSAGKLVEEQQREPATAAEDISFLELLAGLAVGFAGLGTFGAAALALTLLKAPLVFVACVASGIRHSFHPLMSTGWWFLPALAGWLLALAGGCCVLVLVILISALLKFFIAAAWPAYVATGWLRHVGGGGRRRDSTSCCTPFIQGTKAGYQVLWAADLITNACILMRFDLLQQTSSELMEIAQGQRLHLSHECRAIACLPPVVVNLFQGSWDMAERAIASQLGVSTEAVREAWTSLKQQMIHIGEQELAAGLLTEDYVLGVPPELVIGLPARVLLHTLERSSGPELVLATGLRLSAAQRPRGPFAERTWERLQLARAALAGLPAEPDCWAPLRASLLAGGGDPSELPPALARELEVFEQLPPEARKACMAVHRPLIAVAVEMSGQAAFRERLAQVILALASASEGCDN